MGEREREGGGGGREGGRKEGREKETDSQIDRHRHMNRSKDRSTRKQMQLIVGDIIITSRPGLRNMDRH